MKSSDQGLSSVRILPLVALPLYYLDWNIIDGFSKNKFKALRNILLRVRDEGLIHIPYTEWHLYEAASVPNEVVARNELISRNLNALRDITDLVCIWEFDEPPGWRIMRMPSNSKLDVQTTQKIIEVFESMKPMLEAITILRKKLIPFGLTPVILNNFTTEEAVIQINNILLKPENLIKYNEYAPNGITFEDLVQLSLEIMPENANDLMKISGIYFMVDMLGYYGDKKVKKNVMSLWRDSMHVAWASRTQILISDDKRLRMKATLTYRSLGIETVVLDPDEAVNMMGRYITPET